jgi:hypothetical protein
MEVFEARRNDVVVFALKGRLDAVSAPSVRNHLQERSIRVSGGLQSPPPGSPTSAAPGCAFCCKSQSKLEARSGRMVLCALQEPVKRTKSFVLSSSDVCG